MKLEKAKEYLKEIQNNCTRGMMKGAIYTDDKAEEKAIAIETVLQALKNSIPKKKIKDKIKELKNKIKQNENELKKNPDPVNSKFNSFDDYFNWKSKVIYENKLLKEEIKDLQELLEDK